MPTAPHSSPSTAASAGQSGGFRERRSTGEQASRQEALVQLGVLWEARGPVGHGFEAYYRQAAERMVGNAADFIGRETGEYADGQLEAEVSGCIVTVEPDRMVVNGATVHVQEIRTGRQNQVRRRAAYLRDHPCCRPASLPRQDDRR